jgi:Protein of unknown function (DUF3185)
MHCGGLQMKKKRIIGVVILIIGIVLLVLGLYARSRVASARSDVGHITHSPFGQNRATDTVGNVLEAKIGSYDQPVFWCIVGGVVLVVIGGGMVLFNRKKRR